MKQVYILHTDTIKRNAMQAVLDAPDGYVVEIKPKTRNLEQSAKFHAICADVSKQMEFAGKKRTAEQWKVLLVSGHASATKHGCEIVPGIEGEWCNIRESTAGMSVARMASLIEYCLAYCAENEIRLAGFE
jgi:hypothetical protein